MILCLHPAHGLRYGMPTGEDFPRLHNSEDSLTLRYANQIWSKLSDRGIQAVITRTDTTGVCSTRIGNCAALSDVVVSLHIHSDATEPTMDDVVDEDLQFLQGKKTIKRLILPISTTMVDDAVSLLLAQN